MATTKADSPLKPYKADQSDRLYKEKKGVSSKLCAKDLLLGWLIHRFFALFSTGVHHAGAFVSMPNAMLFQ